MADHFTKALGPALFHRHVDYILGHVPPTSGTEKSKVYFFVLGKVSLSGLTFTLLYFGSALACLLLLYFT